MAKRLSYDMTMWICAVAFVAVEVILFPLIQLTSASVSEITSYLAIVFVALFALATCKGAERNTHLIRVGILFTLVADYFLVLSDDAELQGVIAFIFVQLAYLIYLILNDERKAVRVANIATRLGLCAVLTVSAFLVLGEDTDALAIASVIYYANLVVNIIFAFMLGKGERIFAIGLVLFAMCDLCIGLEVLGSSYLDSGVFDFFYGPHLNLPWVFYQPSQVLIALRLYQKNSAV